MDNDRFEWVNESCKNMHLFEQYNKVYNQVLDYLTERGITTRNIHIAVEEPKPREMESASPCFSCQSSDDEPQILYARHRTSKRRIHTDVISSAKGKLYSKGSSSLFHPVCLLN